MKIKWIGKGINEKAVDEKNRIVIKISKKFLDL